MSAPRPGHAPGADRRAARGLRRDGRGADPLRALAEHQGAPRLLDRALRRRRRAGDAGRAHPGPPRLDARRGRRRCSARSSAPGDLWILNDPYRGGTHLPDITLISPVFADGGDADRLRRQPRPPRRRRRPDAGRDARRLAHARGGGGRDPADAASTTRTLARARRRGCAARAQRLADLRAQRAANLTGARRLAELVERARASTGCAPGWRRSSTTPSGAPARAIARAPRRRLRGRATCSRRADGDARSPLRVARDDRRRRARARLRRHRRRRSRATSTARSR